MKTQDKRRSFDPQGSLAELCEMVAADEKVRVVVICGAGEKAFCAGSDISEFSKVLCL